MDAKTYPFSAWRLTPGFKPVPVEIANKLDSWGSGELYQDGNGKFFRGEELHETKQACIDAGNASLDAQEAKVKKMIESISKKRAALAKDQP